MTTSHFNDETGLDPKVRPFNDVMIDIESMSLHPHNALVLSVGMIEFDPNGSELLIGRKRSLVLDWREQIYLGREIDPKTQAWWANPALKEAAKFWLEPESVYSIGVVLQETMDFCRNARSVWANGTQFDLSNLTGLAKQKGFGDLWFYRAPRDARTYYEEVEENPRRSDVVIDFDERYGIVAHEPVSDCITQAYRVWQRKGA